MRYAALIAHILQFESTSLSNIRKMDDHNFVCLVSIEVSFCINIKIYTVRLRFEQKRKVISHRIELKNTFTGRKIKFTISHLDLIDEMARSRSIFQLMFQVIIKAFFLKIIT